MFEKEMKSGGNINLEIILTIVYSILLINAPSLHVYIN
jgi:hypothetical protein